MSWLLPSVVAVLTGSLALSSIYTILLINEKKTYLKKWTYGWWLYSFRFFFTLLLIKTSDSSILVIGEQTFTLLSIYFHLSGTYDFIELKFSRKWLISTFIIEFWIIWTAYATYPYLIITIPIFTFSGIVYIWTGFIILKKSEIKNYASSLTGYSFIIWGFHKFNYPFLRPVIWFAPIGFFLSALLEVIVAIGFLLMFYQKNKTALTNAIQDLNKRNLFIETILDNLPIGLAVNYINEGTATYMNKKFEEIYGWPNKVIKDIPTFFENVYPDPEYRKEITNRINNDIASGDPEKMEWDNIEITTQKGDNRIVLAKNIPLFEQNYMISTVRDVTENKKHQEETQKLNEQLLQSQKMESIGRLAGGVAHDFNNMISVIIGNTELALEQIDPSNLLYTELQEIKKAAEKSSSLTKQLLIFARKQTIQPVLLELNSVIYDLLTLLKRLIGENIDLKLIPYEGDLVVRIDPSQIDQLMTNLCVNAVDAINGTGKIIITTGLVSLDITSSTNNEEVVPGNYVLLTVTDTGCGINSDVLPHIFEPFYSTKEKGMGTGLGLATVYGIVKQNNGHIEVYSEKDAGTAFKIYLPLQNDELKKKNKVLNLEQINTGTETILIVEDEESILKIMLNVLNRLGYRIISATEPTAAIDIAENYPETIHLLITDIIMPNMNGRELSNIINEKHPNIKKLFMSGYSSEIISQHGVINDGMNFIQKPFSIHDLVYKIRNILDTQ